MAGGGRPEGIAVEGSVQAFFHRLVTDALQSTELRVSKDTEYYVVNLLCEFTERRPVAAGSDADLLDEPLAFLFKRAVEAQPGEQLRHLKQLGDVALYMSGFFGDSLKRRRVDVDYYIGMGGSAYDRLSRLLHQTRAGRIHGDMYGEMALRFARLVEVLTDISESQTWGTREDVLRLYEKWLRSPSRRLAQKLAARGIAPVRGDTRVIQ